MKKKNIGLCAVALLCMSGTAKAALPALKQDNTKVVNHAQITAAYKTSGSKKPPLHFSGSRSRNPAGKEVTDQCQAGMDVRKLFPQYIGYHRALSPPEWQTGYFCLHR